MTALDVLDWRRRVHALYARVRAEPDPARAHAEWVAARERLFRTHPASPVPAEQRGDHTDEPSVDERRPDGEGSADRSLLKYGPYDPAMRFTAAVDTDVEPYRMEVPTGTDGVVPFERVGRLHLPVGDLDVWWLDSYGGGVFVPVKDASAGSATYGAGRYLIDTVKGADLGGSPSDGLVVDLNFAYNPSCAYDPAWACPLAPPGNTLRVTLPVGELTP
ncbi:hypothetical protein CLV30_11082 [Haloactinopolyspora alba]|uniref:DUF1684 domain-containing protein n=1 Tax=Haloactinopolyspora alba TaxID=648780 RepID=A0A2P8DZ02_9ACTN|nr:DUF1684 domain-containing protein [Haloactinopolyspora alba]PSL02429.1 hypothetical protein CLV30_11082 [Haloactinopolyspora alba]